MHIATELAVTFKLVSHLFLLQSFIVNVSLLQWGKVTLVDIMVSRGDDGAFALDKHMESLLAKHLQTGYTFCAGTNYMPHHEFILT